MKLLRTIAKLARMSDLPGIQKVLDEAQWDHVSVREGFYDARRAMKLDDPLPQLADGLPIGPDQPPMPSIYPDPPFRSRRKKAA